MKRSPAITASRRPRSSHRPDRSAASADTRPALCRAPLTTSPLADRPGGPPHPRLVGDGADAPSAPASSASPAPDGLPAMKCGGSPGVCPRTRGSCPTIFRRRGGGTRHGRRWKSPGPQVDGTPFIGPQGGGEISAARRRDLARAGAARRALPRRRPRQFPCPPNRRSASRAPPTRDTATADGSFAGARSAARRFSARTRNTPVGNCPRYASKSAGFVLVHDLAHSPQRWRRGGWRGATSRLPPPGCPLNAGDPERRSQLAPHAADEQVQELRAYRRPPPPPPAPAFWGAQTRSLPGELVGPLGSGSAHPRQPVSRFRAALSPVVG